MGNFTITFKNSVNALCLVFFLAFVGYICHKQLNYAIFSRGHFTLTQVGYMRGSVTVGRCEVTVGLYDGSVTELGREPRLSGGAEARNSLDSS